MSSIRSFACALFAVNLTSMNCSSDPCNVTVNEGDNVTVCSEMGPSNGEGPIPVNSTKWMFRGEGGKEKMMAQCKGELKCCEEEGSVVFY